MKSKRQRVTPLGPRFERALVFATQEHAGQHRKGTTVPYVAHLLSVAGLVLEAGGDEDLAIAALLHDVVEDCGGAPMLKEVRRRFGKRVARIVDGCTDTDLDPKPPWRERKENYLKHLRTADADTRLVSAADKLHNVRSIVAAYRQIGDRVWERFHGKRDGTLWYYRALLDEFKRKKSNALIDELEQQDPVCPPAGQGRHDCQAVVVEQLTLDGNGLAGVNGIVNAASQELSRVDNVWLINIAGIGLDLNNHDAANSGPYSKIYFSGSGTCARIGTATDGPSGTRGIHGLTCAMSGSNPAILLDARNNSLEDISISSSSAQDGIQIGANNTAQGNVVINVRGTGLNRVVHISNNTNSLSYCPFLTGSTPNNACDITLLGITGGGNSTIRDELTNTTLTDGKVGMYVVGEQMLLAGATPEYSRFTTSTSLPTWRFGASAPPQTSCTVGDLYSQTSGGSGTKSVWQCVGGGTPWKAVK